MLNNKVQSVTGAFGEFGSVVEREVLPRSSSRNIAFIAALDSFNFLQVELKRFY